MCANGTWKGLILYWSIHVWFKMYVYPPPEILMWAFAHLLKCRCMYYSPFSSKLGVYIDTRSFTNSGVCTFPYLMKFHITQIHIYLRKYIFGVINHKHQFVWFFFPCIFHVILIRDRIILTIQHFMVFFFPPVMLLNFVAWKCHVLSFYTVTFA